MAAAGARRPGHGRSRRPGRCDADARGRDREPQRPPGGPFGPGAPPPPDPARHRRGTARHRPGLRALVRAGGPRAGPARTAGGGHRAPGGVDATSVVDALSQQGVIGSSLAFQVSEVFHGTPTVLPGSYAMHQNLAFSEVRSAPGGRARTSTRSTSGPASRSPRWRSRSTACPATAAGGFAKAEDERRGALDDRRDRSQQPRGHARHRDLPGPPRRERHDHPHGHGAALRPRRAGGRPHHARRPRAGHDAVPGAHRGLDRGEGGLHPGQHARHGPGHLQPTGPGHAAADGLDRPVRAGAGRGTGHGPGPQDPVAVQHLPQHRSDADAHLHAVEDALQAAVHPPPGAWLYFVLVKKNGTMAFSDTYAEQLANEQLAKSRGLP